MRFVAFVRAPASFPFDNLRVNNVLLLVFGASVVEETLGDMATAATMSHGARCDRGKMLLLEMSKLRRSFIVSCW